MKKFLGESGRLKIIRRNMNDPRVRRSISRIVGRTELCSMATVTPTGQAYINTADYAYSHDYELCFISYPESQHARNLKQNSSMAITVFDSHQPWNNPHQGLQFFGNAKEQNDPGQVKRLESLYAKRFRHYRKWKRETMEEEGEFRLRFYNFIPARVKIFDEKEFGEQTWVTASLRRTGT